MKVVTLPVMVVESYRYNPHAKRSMYCVAAGGILSDGTRLDGSKLWAQACWRKGYSNVVVTTTLPY